MAKALAVRFDSRHGVPQFDHLTCPSFSIFDGSQDWVIVDNDEVAGSSPASGSNFGRVQTCRSSSVWSRYSQFVSYPSLPFAVATTPCVALANPRAPAR